MINQPRLPPFTAPPDSLLMLRNLTNSHIKNSMTALGDTILFFSSHGKYMRKVARNVLKTAPNKRDTSRLIGRLAGTRVLSATAGMGMASLVEREGSQRGAFWNGGLMSFLASAEGPQKIGIGRLSSVQRAVLGGVILWASAMVMGWAMIVYPHMVNWMMFSAMLLFATRPDVDSFVRWVKAYAPKVADRKERWVDRARTRLTPYLMEVGRGFDGMGWRRIGDIFKIPALRDYGICSVVVMQDYGGYEYVYLGGLGRWCLLGWYNQQEEMLEDDDADLYRLDIR